MKKILLIILGLIICLCGVFKFSQKATSKNISNSEMSNLLINKDKIIKQDPELRNVYNFTYHVDNKKRILYIIPRDSYQLKDEMDNLRTTPANTSNLNDKTKSEKQFTLLSTQIAQKYGKAWKVQVTNTSDPIFSDIRKSDILWEFQNGKEKGQGTQGGLFKLERILLTPFDYLADLFGIIILLILGKGGLSLIGAGSSASRSDYGTKSYHQPGYSEYNNNQEDDYVNDILYDQYGDAHSIRFKKGDYSKGWVNGQVFNKEPDGGYSSDDGETYLDH
ncbi:hypothetical protein [Limosilactobacillus sp.]|uniref:hypothetical protein n=1 Tax=Limosilactobacillus sp. TaxID=2773925 RepID=UPI003F0BE79D